MSDGASRVLLIADEDPSATELATALETAAGSIGVDLSVTASTDPALSAGDFDCLVCATTVEMAGETGRTLRQAHPSTPLVCYLEGSLSAADVTNLAADALVPQSGDGTLLLAHQIQRLVAGREGRRQLASTTERVDEAVFALDADWRFTYCNEKAEELLERPATELLGESVWETFSAAVGSTFYDEFHRVMRTGDPAVFEEYYDPLDRWFEVAAHTAHDGLVVYFRDTTESRRQSEALSGVLQTTRALMQARTREEVGQLVASAAENTLGFDYNVVRVYDAETETLDPVGWTDAVAADLDEPPSYGLDEGAPGAVFSSGESRLYDADATIDDGHDRDVIAAEMHLPVGVHGTISIGATDGDAFDDVDRQVAEILATNAAVAFSRAKREQEAREARDRVETMLARINGLVRDILEVLVQATTREEIETGVCESLTAADPYTFAWVGSADVTGETLTASTWDGTADLDVAAYEHDLTVDAHLDASAAALRDRERKVVQDLSVVDAPWETRAAEAGLGALCAVPLTFKDTVYGVLTVYADRPDAFDEREQAVLDALGRSIADAINAVERGRILSTSRVIEMELSSRDPDLLFSRLSAQADCRIESTGSVYQSDGLLRLYVTAETDDPEPILEFAADDDTITGITHVVTQDGTSLFELTVVDSVVERLADFGGIVNSLAGEDGVTRLTVELPHEAEARDVYDLLAEHYDDLDLAAYHEHDRPIQTRQEFRAALRERFTDRQETALRSAYLGGFFEWPREIDGDDLATAMDITRPTYHQHLRAAERKVFEELFD